MISTIVKLSAFLLIFSYLTGVESTYYYDCEGVTTVGKVEGVKVTNCDAKDENSKCQLKRGTNITFDLTFKSDVDTNVVKSVVHGVILGEEKKFQLPNDNGCVDSGITCPISKSSVSTYTASLPIKKLYPKLSVDVKWELQDKDGKNLVCIMIPSKLV